MSTLAALAVDLPYRWCHLSLCLSPQCGRGGLLGRNGERSYWLVSLRLCGGGGGSHQRQSIRYDITTKGNCALSFCLCQSKCCIFFQLRFTRLFRAEFTDHMRHYFIFILH